MAEYRLDYTLKLAVENFAKRVPEEMAHLSGVCYDGKQFCVKFLNKEFFVEYPTGQVVGVDEQAVPIRWQILFLHYLCYAKGTPKQNKYISFKELPDGMVYIEPFTKRAIQPMIKMFAHRLQEFQSVTASLGGECQSIGDFSVTIPVFPKLPITLVIWVGDEEFPANGNILFDGSAAGYLPTEDFAIIASELIWFIQRNVN